MNDNQLLNKVMNEIKINHPKRLGFSLVELSRNYKPCCLKEWEELVNKELVNHGWTFDKLALMLFNNCKTINQERCKKYLEELFIEKTFNAFNVEKIVFNEIEQYYNVRWASIKEEFYYALDMIVENIVGVQVKPKSYENSIIDIHKQTIDNNIIKNQLWGEKIVYIFYDKNVIYKNNLINDISLFIKPTKYSNLKNNLEYWL